MKIRICLAALLLLTGLAPGQEQYGNLRGMVVDEAGVPLPGASVVLESDLFDSRALTCSHGGIFRFINLSPGIYRLRCELAGFKVHVRDPVDIRAGTNFDLRIVLTQATLEESVTVVARSPVVDTKRTGTAVSVNLDMLQKLPSARDPWVILQQAPGIFVSQENVGGSASGQQSGFQGRAGMVWNTQWILDGVPITDMISTGGSPGYYDFDTFGEMTITTAGQDASFVTGGVAVNIVTNRGGNRFQALARAFFTNDDLQADNRTQEVKDLGYIGDRIKQIADYGVQLGGPIFKDRLWFWLGYGVQDIRQLTITGYPYDTKLEGINGKLNFRLSERNRGELAFLYNRKLALGRGGGALFPPPTTYDQTSRNPYIKLEDEHTFSPSFLATLKLSYRDSYFELIPKGGVDTQPGRDLVTGMRMDSGGFQYDQRRSFVASLTSVLFKERFLGGGHELRFGVEYRLTPGRIDIGNSGDAFKYYRNGVPYQATVSRRGISDFTSDRWSVFLNDSWTLGRLTLNLGFRLDREDSRNNDASVPASRVAPDLLPAVTYPGYDPGVALTFLSPRLGFTFDLTGDGKTIVRGNLARYGSQEGPWIATTLSSSSGASATYWWNDRNGDNKISTDELTGYPDGYVGKSGNFDPSNPTSPLNLNGVDKDLRVEKSDELLLGIERELFADFSLGGTFILRRNTDLIGSTYYDQQTEKVIQRSDYIGPIAGSLDYGGKTFDYEYWTLGATKPNGIYLLNIPGYYENYWALEFAAVKRLRRRWMLNASFTYQVFTKHCDETGGFDPTNLKMLDGSRAGGVDWMAKLSFLYQLPWGFNISGFANARQGYINSQVIYAPTPARGAVALGSNMNIYIEKPGTTRLPDFYNVDLSLTKDFRFRNAGAVSLCVDAFNIFNFAHVLSRYAQVNSPTHDVILQILNPRVIRFGLRYTY